MLKTTTWTQTLCLTALAGMLGSVHLFSEAAVAEDSSAAMNGELRKALTFYAGFDQGTDAERGGGDRRLFWAPSLNNRRNGKPGLPDGGAVSIAKEKGRFGDALRFERTSQEVVFYQVEHNFLYSNSNWSGTISFWLKLDPNKDLGTEYCDPLFITPRTYNDAALWVDFTDKAPRLFRHGAVPNRIVGNPKSQDFDKTPEVERPLVSVAQPPFSRDKWTHIVITFNNFNTGKPDGISTLYLDGQSAGSVSAREQSYTWSPDETKAVLGINYVGLFDELALFNRALTAAEVQHLHELTCSLTKAP